MSRPMSDVKLLPLPDTYCAGEFAPDVRVYDEGQVHAYARANLAEREREVEGLRLRDAQLQDGVRLLEQARSEAEARAESLEGALRGLLDVSDKFTGDQDEDAATWVAANDAARAALEQESNDE